MEKNVTIIYHRQRVKRAIWSKKSSGFSVSPSSFFGRGEKPFPTGCSIRVSSRGGSTTLLTGLEAGPAAGSEFRMGMTPGLKRGGDNGFWSRCGIGL